MKSIAALVIALAAAAIAAPALCLILHLAGPSLAQDDPGATAALPPPDPLDQLCARIGAPIAQDKLSGLSSHVVTGLAPSYTEVLGTFDPYRTRSTRYLEDGSRTAQFVTLTGRDLCLTRPGETEPICGVPLQCTSGEADYVMVDDQDAPFVRISRPKPPAADAPPPAEDADWVLYAGGTALMEAPSGLVGDSGLTPARNARTRQDCAMGAGYPALDQAWAYFWDTDCGGSYAREWGNVIYVQTDGTIRSLALGAGRGLQTDRGQLTWSISDKPLPIAVECRTASNTTIPTSAEEVKSARVHITLPYTVVLGEPLVYSALVEGANDYVRNICGTDSVIAPGAIEYALHSAGTLAENDLVLRLSSGGVVPKNFATPSVRSVAAAHSAAEVSGRKRFAAYLRVLAEEDRTLRVGQALSGSSGLANLADGVRSADVQTLVALVGGLRTSMPWKQYLPTFSDGQFRQTFSVSSTDPVASYLPKSMADQSGWRAILRQVPAGPADVQLQITCLIPAADAASLSADRWVDVHATLLDFSFGQMVLRCGAP